MISRNNSFWAGVLMLLLSGVTLGQATTATGTGAAAGTTAATAGDGVKISRQMRVNIAWQIALEGANFSPGLIDGHFGRKGDMALQEFAAASFPKEARTGANWPFEKKVLDTLRVDVEGALTKYTVTADDAAQVGQLPDDWNEKSKMSRLPYESLYEMLAEKFHCTKGLLQTLNAGVDFSRIDIGKTIHVPNIQAFPTDNKSRVVKSQMETSYLEINLAQKAIRAFDKDKKQVALFHCSVAKNKAKLPAEDMKVKVIAAPEPQYSFDPRMWPEVKNVTSVLQIPPGPRNPVGLAWVGLTKEGYGMHGSPKPEFIGKTGSHGCFRLTNWDALKLAGMVREQMEVKVVNPEKGE